MANITFYICIYELSNRAGCSTTVLNLWPINRMGVWTGGVHSFVTQQYQSTMLYLYVLCLDYGSFFIAHEVYIMLSINHSNDSGWLKFGFGLGLKIK